MKLLILSGLPGSGKSTFAKKFVSENKDWIRVNRDDLRNMRGEYWIPKQEDLITEMENACAIAAFGKGFNVVLDSTNLDLDRSKARYKMFLSQFAGLSVEYKLIDTPIEECIKRDLARPNSVGSKVIERMYNQHFPPTKVEYKEDKNLPSCVIFDVDGTLAKMNGRSPFDWHKVKEDSINENVVNLLKCLYLVGKKIIIFTGRDGVCLDLTKEWLFENNIPYHDIFIRPQGNTEKDSIIKERLFEENIRGKYYCNFVVDDRDQVIKMWREKLGLTCLQVDYGDF